MRNTITQADLDKLQEAHRILIGLMIGLNPASAAHPPLFAAAFTVRQCAREWSGKQDVWPTANSFTGQGPRER